MSNNTEIRQVKWRDDENALSAVRTTVFVQEQGVPAAVTFDGNDAEALHVLAKLDGQPVGCGRLTLDGKIGRMAVLRKYRGQGLGKRILEELLVVAREKAMSRVFLHAQTHATEFYAAAGFSAEGTEFEEGGLPHVKMS